MSSAFSLLHCVKRWTESLPFTLSAAPRHPHHWWGILGPSVLSSLSGWVSTHPSPCPAWPSESAPASWLRSWGQRVELRRLHCLDSIPAGRLTSPSHLGSLVSLFYPISLSLRWRINYNIYFGTSSDKPAIWQGVPNLLCHGTVPVCSLLGTRPHSQRWVGERELSPELHLLSDLIGAWTLTWTTHAWDVGCVLLTRI